MRCVARHDGELEFTGPHLSRTPVLHSRDTRHESTNRLLQKAARDTDRALCKNDSRLDCVKSLRLCLLVPRHRATARAGGEEWPMDCVWVVPPARNGSGIFRPYLEYSRANSYPWSPPPPQGGGVPDPVLTPPVNCNLRSDEGKDRVVRELLPS